MLETFPMFSSLPKEHLDRLEAISRKISLKKGSILFSPGDKAKGFYAVLNGTVRLYRISQKGKEITLEIAEPGSTFAEASLFSDSYHCYAEALKDSIAYLIGKDAFLDIVRKDVLFAVTWIHMLSMNVIHLRQRIEELSLKSPKARIVSYLLFLSEIQNSSSITLPSHGKSIATLLNMTHETFYRTTHELKNEGLLNFEGRQVEIIDHSLLEDLIE